MATWTWFGASRSPYTYHVQELSDRYSPNQPGNYIFARLTLLPNGEATYLPIYIGETGEGFEERFSNHEHAAEISRHGPTHVHVHLNHDRALREAEETDLCRAYATPVNKLTTPPSLLSSWLR